VERQKFTLTEDHVKLARQMYVRWQDCETGAPEIDPKRPYGNSDVPGDIHEILTGEMVDNDEVVLNRGQKDSYLELHAEMETALQVILAAGTFEPGHFEADAYTARWERVEGP
jgi:hypothetical protein